ncbi:helix-turn-helix domain-containing protein [Arthrobacter sp. SLBN-53]|uniref:helix-turn-helix transcriptional regulator n=1 Tax=Arthrobacter sp. SLBN-53 TaxID=2768412 RepID=UPI0011710E7F|nr:helix-turn-helix domain-containing protein [Arthrobacter sp. SLBN-53]TQK27961.1 helix-turn-helix protein [Arthrobacter sp. SLBN-53]
MRPISHDGRHKPGSDFLTLIEVSAITRLPVGTLRYWRHTGSRGPQSVKLGRRIMYRRADFETWLHEVAPTGGSTG